MSDLWLSGACFCEDETYTLGHQPTRTPGDTVLRYLGQGVRQHFYPDIMSRLRVHVVTVYDGVSQHLKRCSLNNIH